MYRIVTLFLAIIMSVPAFAATFVTRSPFSNNYSTFPRTTYVSPGYTTTTYPRRYRGYNPYRSYNYNRLRHPRGYYAPGRYTPFRRYRNYNSYNTFNAPYTSYEYQTSTLPVNVLSGTNNSPSAGVSTLNLLEDYAFNKTYKRDSDLKRLERLEELAFGAIQSGDYDTRYKNVETAILSRPKNNYRKKTLLSSIGDYFSGQLTGFTPSLIGDDLIPGFTRSASEQFSNGIFGSGYNNFSHNYGTNSGVRILD